MPKSKDYLFGQALGALEALSWSLDDEEAADHTKALVGELEKEWGASDNA